MAFGFFNIVEPGLTYVGRASYRANSGLSTDPNDADAVQAGELLSLNASQELIRPLVTTTVVDANQLIFPVLVDKARTDVQSTNSGPGSKLTVLVHLGALAITNQFATKTAAGVDITAYEPGALLVPCTFYAADDTTLLSGYCPLGTATSTPAAGAGRVVSVGVNAIASCIRAPYNISGVGVSAGAGFPSTSQVIEVLVTGVTS